MSIYLHRSGLLAQQLLSSAAPAAVARYDWSDLALQLPFDEADTSTSGSDTGPDGYTWTGVGNAVVNSAVLELDGSGDYLTLDSDAHDWNFLHSGQPWTIEFTVVGRPTGRSTIMATNRSASSSVGIWVCIEDGSVAGRLSGSVQVTISRGVNGDPIYSDATSVQVIPNDSMDHHVVIEHEPGHSNGGTQQLTFGFDGNREDTVPFGSTEPYNTSDSSFDLMVGRANNVSSLDYDGDIRNLRIWRGVHRYDLLNNATYTPDDDESVWITSNQESGARVFPPRFYPNDETNAATGRTPSDFYRTEPRFIDLGSGTIVSIRMNGPSHAGNTGMFLELHTSTDHGRTFPDSSRVVVDSDGTYAVRNQAVGRDSSSGRLICFARTANGSNTTQDTFYLTSTDDGATWSSRTSVSSSLTGSGKIPWGKIVNTDNGLCCAFYERGLCELLFSTDGGQTWGSKVEVYSGGGATNYDEPFIVRVDSSNLVIFSRIEGQPDDFAIYESSDGGSTWSFVEEAQWTASTINKEFPMSGAVIDGKVMMVWGARRPIYKVYYTLTDTADFLADPARAIDGTETQVELADMVPKNTTSSSDPDYGYTDVLPLTSSLALVGWYSRTFNGSATNTRTFHTVIEI